MGVGPTEFSRRASEADTRRVALHDIFITPHAALNFSLSPHGQDIFWGGDQTQNCTSKDRVGGRGATCPSPHISRLYRPTQHPHGQDPLPMAPLAIRRPPPANGRCPERRLARKPQEPGPELTQALLETPLLIGQATSA